jgi:hypothetical protein
MPKAAHASGNRCASPEQADTMTGEIDETSGVYSPGVLLDELLIGPVPFGTAMLRNAGLLECSASSAKTKRRRCRESLPPWGAAVTDIAERRQTDPVSLRRLVDGDPNSITMKALRGGIHS